jgi:pyruvate dehydrogenase E1 component alpha subunit
MAKAKKESGSAVADPSETDCAPQWSELLKQMYLIRRFEEATEREFRKGKIGGYLHVYIGQEAIASGIVSALNPGDAVFCGYRDHAQALSLGSDPNRVMAELFGKGTGISKGKGGSMHLFDVGHGLYGGYGIVGGHLTLAVGAAYAQRYRGTDQITLCYFGDGAMNIGSFHEAMNMAGLWGHQGMCPIIFIIENNGYAMGTKLERHSALTDLSARVEAYDIPTEKVDGQDIFAVRGVADRVVRQVRETGKPYCIEAVTYRFSGHGAADILQPYRNKEEVEQHKQRDPINILRTRLAEVCGLADDEVKGMDEWATKVAADAVKFAEESPQPDPGELFTDVVAEHGPRPVRESETE